MEVNRKFPARAAQAQYGRSMLRWLVTLVGCDAFLCHNDLSVRAFLPELASRRRTAQEDLNVLYSSKSAR